MLSSGPQYLLLVNGLSQSSNPCWPFECQEQENTAIQPMDNLPDAALRVGPPKLGQKLFGGLCQNTLPFGHGEGFHSGEAKLMGQKRAGCCNLGRMFAAIRGLQDTQQIGQQSQSLRLLPGQKQGADQRIQIKIDQGFAFQQTWGPGTQRLQ